MREEKLKAKIEAALYMSNQPITLDKLSKLLKADKDKIKGLLEVFKTEYNSDDHGVYLLETESGYQIKVKPEYVSHVGTLTPYRELSRGLLRVLALVAYKQPITQSEIVKVLGNRTYEYVKKLEQRGLIKTERSSRTKALVATKEFATYFGLEKPEDAKKFFENIETEAKEIEKDEEELEEVIEEEMEDQVK